MAGDALGWRCATRRRRPWSACLGRRAMLPLPSALPMPDSACHRGSTGRRSLEASRRSLVRLRFAASTGFASQRPEARFVGSIGPPRGSQQGSGQGQGGAAARWARHACSSPLCVASATMHAVPPTVPLVAYRTFGVAGACRSRTLRTYHPTLVAPSVAWCTYFTQHYL